MHSCASPNTPYNSPVSMTDPAPPRPTGVIRGRLKAAKNQLRAMQSRKSYDKRAAGKLARLIEDLRTEAILEAAQEDLQR